LSAGAVAVNFLIGRPRVSGYRRKAIRTTTGARA